ncbi:MAG TPA: hypothetical protein VJ997_07565 [Longimicrobiales bacterium]|nr:hypothetical protein [Longimicrobiales bacterium]
MKRSWLLLAASLAFARVPASAQEGGTYRTLTVQAAPGHLLELIDLYKEEAAFLAAVGEEPALAMRHSQGDLWDLMLVYPIQGLSAYFDPERTARIARARTTAGRTGAELQREIDARTTWREEVFVHGPAVTEVKAAWAGAGLFHVEMYQGLAGKRDELVRERHMENAYATALGRNATKVFTRIAGSATDGFTVGFYDDLKAYANPPERTREQQEAAAVAAGFRGADYIGATLRELILRHHDTLAVPIS